MDKKEIIEKLLVNYEKRKEDAEKTFASYRQSAIDAPGAMQSKSDTTKFQMSRLAESSSKACKRSQDCISVLEKIKIEDCQKVKIGAIVKIEENGNTGYYFVLPPSCSGETINLKDQEINVIVTESPIAQALLGKKTGDKVDIKVPIGVRAFKILEIR